MIYICVVQSSTCSAITCFHWLDQVFFLKSARFSLNLPRVLFGWRKFLSLRSETIYEANSWAVVNIIPFLLCWTSSGRLGYPPIAKQGSYALNISTTFIGRSNPELDVCKQIPKSAEATIWGYSSVWSQAYLMLTLLYLEFLTLKTSAYSSFYGPFPVTTTWMKGRLASLLSTMSSAETSTMKSSSGV